MANGKFIIGNWKMNGDFAHKDLVKSIMVATEGKLSDNLKVGICPPFPYISYFKDVLEQSGVNLGAQDCHFNEKGAHTGDVSISMLKEVGCDIVIVGHSERRANHFENDEIVCAKANAVLSKGLIPIICVGETDEQRKSGKAIEIVLGQVSNSCPKESPNIVIAYEPVWAIGTGNVASPQDIEEMHLAIRERLISMFGAAGEGVQILYGGSVNAANAKEILAIANVDGALVGGASLKASDFATIIESA